MEFKGFSEKTLPFLESIRQNNDKEWFEAHRDEYEKYILEPSRVFVEEFGEHLQALEPTINFSPKMEVVCRLHHFTYTSPLMNSL